MKKKEYHLHDGKTGSALAIRVTPRASRNEVVEIMSDGVVRIRLTAPPIDGKANSLLVDFLAEILDVPKSNIDIVVGANSRDKLVSIFGVDSQVVQERILHAIV